VVRNESRDTSLAPSLSLFPRSEFILLNSSWLAIATFAIRDPVYVCIASLLDLCDTVGFLDFYYVQLANYNSPYRFWLTPLQRNAIKVSMASVSEKKSQKQMLCNHKDGKRT